MAMPVPDLPLMLRTVANCPAVGADQQRPLLGEAESARLLPQYVVLDVQRHAAPQKKGSQHQLATAVLKPRFVIVLHSGSNARVWV